MAALLSEETEGKEVLPSGLRGLTAYRYWQRPVPSGTGFILADLSYVVKLSEGMMRSSKEAHRIQQFCGDASSAAVWNSIAPV